MTHKEIIDRIVLWVVVMAMVAAVVGGIVS